MERGESIGLGQRWASLTDDERAEWRYRYHERIGMLMACGLDEQRAEESARDIIRAWFDLERPK